VFSIDFARKGREGEMAYSLFEDDEREGYGSSED
jgi:hypothetical protein